MSATNGNSRNGHSRNGHATTNGHSNRIQSRLTITDHRTGTPVAIHEKATKVLWEFPPKLCGNGGPGALVLMPTATLREMVPDFNPDRRVVKQGKATTAQVGKLMRSLDDIGFCSTALINNKIVLEGNRRTAAMFERGLDEVPVIARPLLGTEAYAALNSTVKPHGSSEKVEAWLVEPLAVTDGFALKCEAVENYIGRSTLTEMVQVKHRNPMQMYSTALRLWGKLLDADLVDSPDMNTVISNTILVQYRLECQDALKSRLTGDVSRKELRSIHDDIRLGRRVAKAKA